MQRPIEIAAQSLSYEAMATRFSDSAEEDPKPTRKKRDPLAVRRGFNRSPLTPIHWEVLYWALKRDSPVVTPSLDIRLYRVLKKRGFIVPEWRIVKTAQFICNGDSVNDRAAILTDKPVHVCCIRVTKAGKLAMLAKR